MRSAKFVSPVRLPLREVASIIFALFLNAKQ
jgi:hypothetical protein